MAAGLFLYADCNFALTLHYVFETRAFIIFTTVDILAHLSSPQ